MRVSADRHKNIRCELVVSEPGPGYKGMTGFITGDVIKKCVGDVKGKTFYLCGPELMYRFVEPELIKLGVPGRRIKKESSGPPTDVTREPGWPAGDQGRHGLFYHRQREADHQGAGFRAYHRRP